MRVDMYCVMIVFFCFKQKTAYEMRISDWSSDVCSSDLCPIVRGRELTDRLIQNERAMSQNASELVGLFADLVRKNPRRISASFDRHSSMLERIDRKSVV